MSNSNPEPALEYKLTTKNLFNHFFLIHDFLLRFTKLKAPNSQFLDTQIDIQSIMNNATSKGGVLGQIAAFVPVAAYCLKGRVISLKFLGGFLYVYWLNHFYTLGQYFGALINMPKAYKRAGQYFEKNEVSHPNLLDKFQEIMDTQKEYDDTNDILRKLFPSFYEVAEGNTYTTNDYFSKNRQKYNLPTEQDNYSNKNLKLAYMDSFLTRYVYYSFSRWFHRLKLFLGLAEE